MKIIIGLSTFILMIIPCLSIPDETNNSTVHVFLLMVPQSKVEALRRRGRQEEAAGGAVDAIAGAIGPAANVGMILQGVLGGDLSPIFAGSTAFIPEGDFREGVTEILQQTVAPAIKRIIMEFNKNVQQHFNTTTPRSNQTNQFQQQNLQQPGNFNPQYQPNAQQFPPNYNQYQQGFPPQGQLQQQTFNPAAAAVGGAGVGGVGNPGQFQQQTFQPGAQNQYYPPNNQNFQPANQFPQNQIQPPPGYQPNQNQFQQQNIQPNFSQFQQPNQGNFNHQFQQNQQAPYQPSFNQYQQPQQSFPSQQAPNFNQFQPPQNIPQPVRQIARYVPNSSINKN